MKVWHSYGSEHSAAIGMIGRFKSEQDANVFLTELGQLQETISAVMPDYEEQGRFPKEIMESLLYEKIKFCYDMSPKDLDDFLLEYSIDKDEFCKMWVKMNKSRDLAVKVKKAEQEIEAENKTRLADIYWRLFYDLKQDEKFTLMGDEVLSKNDKIFVERLDFKTEGITASNMMYNFAKYLNIA